QILLLGEKVIDKSSFKVSIPINITRESGIMRLDGIVQGNINGRFVGEMHGILRGDASILVATGSMQKMNEDSADLLEDKETVDTTADINESPEDDTSPKADSPEQPEDTGEEVKDEE
ncbi:MAG: hypothetical protein IJ827_03110, partial [Lachnospiraceae bacterium]|nr:hypothetical protein [Lachnospiraceae bacterium]